MTDVFEEVEEGLRQDRAGALWKRFGPWVIAACLLIILGVAGNEVWKSLEGEKAKTASVAFSDAMNSLDAWQEASEKMSAAAAQPEPQRAALAAAAGAARQDAIAKLTSVAKASDFYGTLAKQQLAELTLVGEPDTAKAAGYLDEAAKGEGVYAELSRIKLAYLKADTASLAELTTLLEPLMKQQGPTKSMARELLAAKKLAAGDVAGARADYQSLSTDIDAPQGVRARVQRALATMPKPTAAPAPAAAPSGSPAPAPSAQATK